MKAIVFYSWQSDTPQEVGRDWVRRCLERAISRLAQDTTLIVRPELDHDTEGLPGSPNVISAILTKIDQATAFVADVTPTYKRRNPGPERTSPNPNVLVELGYALKRLGRERLLLLLNMEYGAPENLPFDLRGDRVVPFRPDNADQFTSELESALRLIIEKAGVPPDLMTPVRLELKRLDHKIESERHEYRLSVRVENTSEEVLSGWTLEVVFPQAMLRPNYVYPVARSDSNGMVVMRQTESRHSGPLYPGDSRELIGIDYYMDHKLFFESEALFQKEVVASFFVGTRRIARVTQRVGELQIF